MTLSIGKARIVNLTRIKQAPHPFYGTNWTPSNQNRLISKLLRGTAVRSVTTSTTQLLMGFERQGNFRMGAKFSIGRKFKWLAGDESFALSLIVGEKGKV